MAPAESIGIDVLEDTSNWQPAENADNATEKSSITLHWSLAMSGPEEEDFSVGQTKRRTSGTIIAAILMLGYTIRRVVLLATESSELAWSGPVIDGLYFALSTLVLGGGIAVLYWRCDPRHANKIKFASTLVLVVGYMFYAALMLGSAWGGDINDCEDRLLWIALSKNYCVVPLLGMLCAMPLYWNALGYIVLAVIFNSAPIGLTTASVVTDAGLQTCVILVVLYQTEYLLRTSFLLARTHHKEAENAHTLASSFSKLVSTITHDLKTPMSAIQVGMSLLSKLSEQNQFSQMALVLREMNSATKMGMSFLDSLASSAALLDKGDTELEADFCALSIPDVIDSALSTCRLYSTSGTTFTSTVQEGLDLCVSSETMLVRNLLNLVTNAATHACQEGTIHTAAGFKCFPDVPGKIFIEFSVSDNGRGIGQEYRGVNRERIWMPFESGAKSTGLGLFVVKRQCDALNGRCGWRDNQPQGTVFWFAVPFIATEHMSTTEANVCQPAVCKVLHNNHLNSPRTGKQRGSAQSWPPAVPVEVPLTVSYATPTILLIDDDPIQSALLTMEFKSIGIHKVEAAAGAAAGLRMLQRERYAIAFCDYNMPGQNGAELVSQFREWELTNRPGEPTQPIWALTAELCDNVPNACREAGMNGVFIKPLQHDLALQLIESLSK